MSIKIEAGKVYLRDVRTGQVHAYEPLLAQMQYMHKFTGGPPGSEIPEEFNNIRPIMPDLSPQERAAEFDRIARMTNEQREEHKAQLARQSELVAELENIPPPELPKKRYAFTELAKGVTDMTEWTNKGWTVPLLVQHEILVEVFGDASADVSVSE